MNTQIQAVLQVREQKNSEKNIVYFVKLIVHQASWCKQLIKLASWSACPFRIIVTTL